MLNYELENTNTIEYGYHNGTYMFLLFAEDATMRVFQTATNPVVHFVSDPFPFYEALSHGYPVYFANYSTASVTGHQCRFNYSGPSSDPCNIRCIISSNFGDTDISFRVNTQTLGVSVSGFYGAYMPFGTYTSTGQMLLTPSYYVTIVKRHEFWVEGAPFPQDKHLLLVYPRIGDNDIGPSFTAKDCIQITGGIPGRVFTLDSDSKFTPALVKTFYSGEAASTDIFGVTSNQFNKVLLFRITGLMRLNYKYFYGEISSKTYFYLKAFNDFGVVEVEKLFDRNSVGSWIWTLVAYTGTGLLFLLIGLGCWGAYSLEKKMMKKKENLIDT